MKHLLLSRLTLPGCLIVLLSATSAQAQQPTIDPGLVPTRCYAPAAARQAVQLPDGKRVLLGDWVRAEGTSTGPLVRYLAGGTQPDAVFNTNTQGLTGEVQQVLPLANGQLLVVSHLGYSLTLGPVTRRVLLRLNADGTPDATFSAGTATGAGGSIHAVLEQPDGKLVIGGGFASFNGQPAGGLVRLNPDGSLDTAFQTALGNNGFDNFFGVLALARQPDGKLLVSGGRSTTPGQRPHTLLRLLPTGALDATFDDRAGRATLVAGLALQPDGHILAALAPVLATDSLGGAPANGVVRLDATGQRDASFVLDAQVSVRGFLMGRPSEPVRSAVLVQPDGHILVAGPQRLLASGARDASFAPDTTFSQRLIPASMQVLPNGQVLLAGPLRHYAGAGAAAQGVAVLNADGQRDAAFVPSLKAVGRLNAVAQQPDGKLLVAGFFDELNGQRVGNVARLLADGSADLGYSPAKADDEVTTMALQADGKVLLGGRFLGVGPAARPGLARLLPGGALDAAFAPALTRASNASSPYYGPADVVQRVVALPGGAVLVAGNLRAGPSHTKIVRLDAATGQLDATFQLRADTASTVASVEDVLVQPNGNLVVAYRRASVAGYSRLLRLLPGGGLDPAFLYTGYTGGEVFQIKTLAQDAAGRLYFGGEMYSSSGGTARLAVRLLPDGTPDNSFSGGYPYSGLGLPVSRVSKLLVQANGRVLVGGYFVQPTTPPAGQMPYEAGLGRLLATGAFDSSFDPTRGPQMVVADMLVQPDGAIVAVGAFTAAGGQAYHGLVRLRDANVLAVAGPQPLLARTEAWPVPARGQLHLALAAEAHPRQVQLLDALGRSVLTQLLTTAECTVNTAALPAGVYLLRVDYATGPVSRRVVLE
ncbi:T9SS type A sorting domain-containing protein [Hymenobacter sp. DH14]|uniref:T9SS type A sorting domain-containing protein n=1 Tax=Hymenobacter cyanobacteriorum TaxID=2926463 RepID=A0A9X2AHA5_9BACT|nr:T9SS type A sorting domain-containing protein [Hymenobacter cyanobacteriorum]MCI1188603.1 T9SS type A sorting domain-containing protein [Hymenobacter cyanobacteriorum]